MKIIWRDFSAVKKKVKKKKKEKKKGSGVGR